MSNGGKGQFYVKEKGSLTLEEMLKLRRSDQSGSKTLTGAYAAVYTDNGAYPWIFAGGWIDLSALGAGDTVYIRVRSKGKSGGSLIIRSENPYTGPQAALEIRAFPNVYGVEISAYQSAGAPPYESLDMEFFTAKR